MAITAVTAEIFPGSLTPSISVTASKSVAANGGASLAFTIAMTDAVRDAMSNRTANAQIRITFTGADGTTYTSGRLQCEDAVSLQRFKLLKTRTAPVISGVTWVKAGQVTSRPMGI